MEKVKIAFLALLIFPLCIFAQGINQPPVPPVDIEFIVPSNPQTNQELNIIIKVTSKEDIHADISCALPSGVEPIHEKNVRIMPYRQERGAINSGRQVKYKFSVGLWIGLLKARETKEFSFHIKMPEKGRYELFCIFDALAKWGEQEKAYTLAVN